MAYNQREIERKWQKHWEEDQTFRADNNSEKTKCYVLDMFPYPSGSGLHVGHPLGYIASDIYARYKRQKGFNVLHPMGYDSFGLPAEQYAIERGIHPATSTDQNIERFRTQLKNIGLSFDWSRELKTSDPSYYKWTQYLFGKLYEHYYDVQAGRALPISELITHFANNGSKNHNAYAPDLDEFTAEEWQTGSAKWQSETLMNCRLAYRKVSYVNWCEELGTVLANDEVVNGLSERGGYPVVQRPMKQWALRITAYADRLEEGLGDLDWADSLKLQQKHWIGRSEGMQIEFEIDGSEEKIQVFTTRADTIYGATFIVLAPEHDLIDSIVGSEYSEKIEDYKKYTKTLSELERQMDKKVSGEFTGAYAIHPINGKNIPIYISEYVLMQYGTGAVMAVPAEDKRDRRFAEKYDLEIVEVIDRSGLEGSEIGDKQGTLINSDILDGLSVPEAIDKIRELLTANGIGSPEIQYKLRDANFSRQRYWGEPFPILYDEEDIPKLLSEEDLPLKLPDMEEIKPKDGKSPLSNAEEWLNQVAGMKRETDTMPGYAGSSWYFLRFMDTGNSEEMFSKNAVDYWKNVDLYVGGAEHAVGHLMYSRFWFKFLYDLGIVSTREPFLKLVNQGMIQGVSLYLEVKRQNGIDRLNIPITLADEKNRLHYGVFLKLLEEDMRFKNLDIDKDIQWKVDGDLKYTTLIPEQEKMSKRKLNVINPDDVIEEYGVDTFRMYEMFLGPIQDSKPWNTQGISGVSKFLNRFWSQCVDDEGNLKLREEQAGKEELNALHTAIKQVNEEILVLSFNTCISAFMILLNKLRELESYSLEVFEPFIRLLAPFAPHICEELWEKLGHRESVSYAPYPSHSEEYLREESATYPVCVQGKKRAEMTVPANMEKEDLIENALDLENVQKHIDGKTVRKVIVVPGRMINIVV